MKRNSLSFKTLKYFVIFSIVILLILWILQIKFLDVFYQKYQTNNVLRIAKQISKDYDKKVDNLEDYAYQNDMCIEYLSYNDNIKYNIKNPGCILNSYDREIIEIKNKLLISKENFVKINDPINGTKNLIYLVKLNKSEFVFLNVTLEDLSIATSILKHQIIYIIGGLIISSILVSYLIAKRINKPIVELTETASNLSQGKFDVNFKKYNIDEIDELSNVLGLAATEMNKTDQLRRDLLANVGHDLKTPLTMIKAYAEKIMDISYKDQKMCKKDLKVIIDETDRLNLLVNDVLDLSRLESSKETLNIEKYDLVENLNEIIKRFDILLNENYKFIIDTPKKAIINADKHKIEQVIYNLINNAIEHTGDDLKVYISIKSKSDYYLVSIKDTGVGLTDEEKELVWNKYYKTEKKHKRNVVGTGLGLSIVKQVLEIHNFSYGIDSVKGKYTTFYFKIKK